MGEFYSKPATQGNQTLPNTSSGNIQSQRSRENATPGSTVPSSEYISSGALDVLSQLNPGNNLPISVMNSASLTASNPDQQYGSCLNRNGRQEIQNNNTSSIPNTHAGSFTPEDMFAAAQLCSHLNPSQLSALLNAYHQQHQQQLQRSTGAGVSGLSLLGHVPGINLAQALASVTPITKSSPSTVSSTVQGSNHALRQATHVIQTVPSYQHQKRPPSGQTQFQTAHGNPNIPNSSRPSSACQAMHHRGNPPGPPNFAYLNPHISLPQSINSSHPDTNSLNLPAPHHTTRASPTLSSSPINNAAYQGRRSQLAPPSTHPNKRPRISTGAQPTHLVSSIPTGHGTTATSMEALISSVVASKAMASLAAGSNFLNPGAYSAATEAAAAALSPFYSLINTNNPSSAPSITTANQPVYHSHLHPHQRTPGSLGNNAPVVSHAFNQRHLISPVSTYPNSLMPPLSGSLLNSIGNGRPSFSHGPPRQNLPSSQAIVSVNNFVSQPSPNHPVASHLGSKPHHVSTPQNTSRLISGHLQHSHFPAHPPQHNFHQTHPLPQPNTQHHVMGHANLPQGSGVLRQQTKEPAYHPQVEAISPAPDESRMADTQDAKLHREREEINRQLTVLDADINKQQTHLRNLSEREAYLSARLTNTPTRQTVASTLISTASHSVGKPIYVVAEQNGPTDKKASHELNAVERTYENPILAIISDNRQRTRMRHLIFTKLCGTVVKPGPYALPFYRQPSDLPGVRAIHSEFRAHFRSKLIAYLRKRLRAEQSRINFLAQQYSRHSKIFTKKMDKILSSTKRRQRDLRYRDIFEKVLPEVKKNREDRELTCADYAKSGMEDDATGLSTGNLSDGTQSAPYDPVEEMNKFKEYAIDPPVMLGPWQRRYQFICESGLVVDCRTELQVNQDLSKWTDEEKSVFKERFLATPKNFVSIAAHLERKTVAECIHYYYLSKKKEGYKQLLKKHNARRRRTAPTERGASGAGGSGGGGTGSGSGGANTGLNNGSMPPSSSSFPNGHSTTSSPHLDSNVASDKESLNFKSTEDMNEVEECTTTNKDSESTRYSRRESIVSTCGSSRTRPGRSRPSTNCNQNINSDDSVVLTSTKYRSTGNGSRIGSNHSNPTIKESISESPNDASNRDSKVDDEENIAIMESSASNTLSSELTTVTESISNGSALVSDQASNLSTCIKDIIHFAIEKNLTKPSNNKCGNLAPTEKTTSTDSSHEKQNNKNSDTSTKQELNVDVSNAQAVSFTLGANSGIVTVVPSSTQANMTKNCQFNVPLGVPESSQHWNTLNSAPTQSATSQLSDSNSSSKAILIGDFLTAQQLGRADTDTWNNGDKSVVINRSVTQNDNRIYSRSINPSTLPIPSNRTSHVSPTNINRNHSNVQESNHPVPYYSEEKTLDGDLLAEHAIRLAMRAKAAATAAANLNNSGGDSASTYINSVNNIDITPDVESDQTTKVPSITSENRNVTSFTTAKYIDALIYSHLNRSNRTTDECSGVTFEPAPVIVSDMGSTNTSDNHSIDPPVPIKPLSNCINNIKNSFDTVINSTITQKPHTDSGVAVVGRQPLPTDGVSLENQINKAIAEEICAQIMPKSCITSFMRAVQSPHSSDAKSTLNHMHPVRRSNNTRTQPLNMAKPFKKRDRRTSHSPNIARMVTHGGTSNDSEVLVKPPASDNGIYELNGLKTGRFDRVFFHQKSLLTSQQMDTFTKPLHTNLVERKQSPEKLSPVNISEQSGANVPHNSNDSKKPESLSVNISSPMNKSSSPVSDLESPGQLLIDLATSDTSPPALSNTALLSAQLSTRDSTDFSRTPCSKQLSLSQTILDETNNRWKYICTDHSSVHKKSINISPPSSTMLVPHPPTATTLTKS